MDTSLEDTLQMIIWETRIPGYIRANRNSKKKLKDNWKKMNAAEWRAINDPQYIEEKPLCKNLTATEIKKRMEEPMYAQAYAAQALVVDNTAKLSAEKDYLLNRARVIQAEREYGNLRKEFNIDSEDRPTSFKELRERLEAGTFTLPEDDVNYPRHIDINLLVWRDPSKKRDDKGYNEALKVLQKLYVETCDTIIVSDLEDGRKALKKLETEKLH